MIQYAHAVKDERLAATRWRICFCPKSPVWFVLPLLELLANRQMGLLEGSCTDFVASLEDRYKISADR